MSKNSEQNEEFYKFGSMDFEITTDFQNWINLGGMSNINAKESFTKVTFKPHNRTKKKSWIKEHKMEVSGDMFEINFNNFHVFREGLDKKELISGVLQLDQTQHFEANSTMADKLYIIEKQNFDKALLNIKKIECSEDFSDITKTVTELNIDVDYKIIKNEKDQTCVVFLTGIDYDSAKQIRITYDVTETAYLRYTSGGKKTLNAVGIRLTNYNESGKKFQMTFFESTVSEGFSFEFQDSDSDEPNKIPVKFECECDGTRESGEQLFEIIDEQGV